MGVDAVGFALSLAPGPGEEAPRILLPLCFNDDSAFQRGLDENHEYTLTSGIGTTNCPPHDRIYDS